MEVDVDITDVRTILNAIDFMPTKATIRASVLDRRSVIITPLYEVVTTQQRCQKVQSIDKKKNVQCAPWKDVAKMCRSIDEVLSTP